MKIALQSIPLLSDLIPVVLINKTSKNFIFSDNPVVFHNTALNLRKFSTLGIQSPGLQIFCPLGDKIAVMMYDPKLYTVNMKNYSLEIQNENDVDHLNELQFLNCDATIFYSDSSKEQEVKSTHDKVKHLTGKRKMKKDKIRISDDEEGRQREFLHFYEEKPNYNLELSFVTINQVSDVGLTRNPYMVERTEKDIKKFDRAYESKLYGVFYKIEFTLKRLRFRIKEKLGMI